MKINENQYNTYQYVLTRHHQASVAQCFNPSIESIQESLSDQEPGGTTSSDWVVEGLNQIESQHIHTVVLSIAKLYCVFSAQVFTLESPENCTGLNACWPSRTALQVWDSWRDTQSWFRPASWLRFLSKYYKTWPNTHWIHVCYIW